MRPVANAFHTASLGVGTQVGLRASQAPDDRLSWVHAVARSVPASHGRRTHRRRLDAGATPLKPAKKGFWGYGGVVRAPDGTIWKVATSSKKDTGPATRQIDDIVLLLGVADVGASKRFYVGRGLAVGGALGASTSNSTRRQRRSSWRSTGALPWPKTPASPRTARDRTGSSLAAMPGPSPTRMGSRGRPTKSEGAACSRYVLCGMNHRDEGSFKSTAARMRVTKAFSSISSSSRTSIARRVLPSRLELNSPDGSSSRAPLKNVSLTTLL